MVCYVDVPGGEHGTYIFSVHTGIMWVCQVGSELSTRYLMGYTSGTCTHQVRLGMSEHDGYKPVVQV